MTELDKRQIEEESYHRAERIFGELHDKKHGGDMVARILCAICLLGEIGMMGWNIELQYQIHQTREEIHQMYEQLNPRIVTIQTHEAEDRGTINQILKSPTLLKEKELSCVSLRGKFYPGEENHLSECRESQ